MKDMIIDTSKKDWASDFLAKANDSSTLILPAAITGKSLSEYIVALGNLNGGYILVGAYSHNGYGSGYESVSHDVIENAKAHIQGLDIEIGQHSLRGQQVYLIKVPKTESIAFSDGSPYVLRDGSPALMSEKTMLTRLGLGIDSSLINMLSEQITKQSSKVDGQSKEINRLTSELQEKSKFKYQVPGLLIGAFIGWLLSTVLNNMLGIS
ncbi:hypothetical protein K6O87_002303 [Vibrio vulnificus]|nr:hypothetical protein [Vibrio vulnificus]